MHVVYWLVPPGSSSKVSRIGSSLMGTSAAKMAETISPIHATSVGPYRTSITPTTVASELARCTNVPLDVVIAVAGWEPCTD